MMFKKTICALIMLSTLFALVHKTEAAPRRRRSSSRSRQMRRIQKAIKAEQKRYQKQYKKDLKEYQKYQKKAFEQQQKNAVIARERRRRRKKNRLKRREEKSKRRREFRLKNKSDSSRTGSRKPSVVQHVSPSKLKQLMKKLDKDNNGSLSKREVKGSLFEEQFRRLDKNKDGKIVPSEAYYLHVEKTVSTKTGKKEKKSPSFFPSSKKEKKSNKKQKGTMELL